MNGTPDHAAICSCSDARKVELVNVATDRIVAIWYHSFIAHNLYSALERDLPSHEAANSCVIR